MSFIWQYASPQGNSQAWIPDVTLHLRQYRYAPALVHKIGLYLAPGRYRM